MTGDSMAQINKLVGLKYSEFTQMITTGEISAQPARLIPILKDEMALTSIFLSGLRLINEFQKFILSETDSKNGKIYVYTEVDFKKSVKGFESTARIDGLLIVVKGENIVDSTIFEMKAAKQLEVAQIEKYIELAKCLQIPRIVTIANNVTASSGQFPLDVKAIKAVKLMHFSWEYVYTVAHMFLNKKVPKIEDNDQRELMAEISIYLENSKSAVKLIPDMTNTWTTLVEKINSKLDIRDTDDFVKSSLENWCQIEGHLCLALSRSVGEFVEAGHRKFQDNWKGKMLVDGQDLIKEKHLSTFFNVKGAASNIDFKMDFGSKCYEMIISLKAPEGKPTKSQITWFKGQLEGCTKKKDVKLDFKNRVFIEVEIKNTSKSNRYQYGDFDKIQTDFKDREIRGFKIGYIETMDGFKVKKVLTDLECMLVNFYSDIVQNVKNAEVLAPKVLPIETNVVAEIVSNSESEEEKREQNSFEATYDNVKDDQKAS